ncbi:MAG: FtsQ-type POTRA domain-containing protein [Tepidiformaceae bacterium]
MIIKRDRKPKRSVTRAIIKRNQPVIGEKRVGTIVKRQRGVTPLEGSGSGGSAGPRLPKRWIWGTGAVLVLALVIAGVVWTWQSPVFRVSEVQVVGNQRTSNVSVVEKVNLIGDSMFTADLLAAQKGLYKLPLVASVKVERSWPNTVKVTIEERHAWGTWVQDGVNYTIDRDGVVLGTDPAPDGSPVIRSSEEGSRVQGERVDYQAVDAAAEIYEKLPRQLGTTVTQVAFIAGKGVQVTTANNQTALFGDSSSISYKLAVWAALAQQAAAQKINYTTVDLRYGNRPVLQ